MIGFRIKQSWTRASAETVAAFRDLPVANVSDCMNRAVGTALLRPLHGSAPLVGTAVTVRTRPGDNLMINKAVDMAQPGDVLVVDGGGYLEHAVVGELLLAHAKVRGLAGMVIDGAVRDSDACARLGLPLFARGVTHKGPSRDGPGEIGYPVTIAGMIVEPGDIILGDLDGLVAVPKAEAEAILAQATERTAAEPPQLADVLAGRSDRSWIDKALKARGCTFEP